MTDDAADAKTTAKEAKEPKKAKEDTDSAPAKSDEIAAVFGDSDDDNVPLVNLKPEKSEQSEKKRTADKSEKDRSPKKKKTEKVTLTVIRNPRTQRPDRKEKEDLVENILCRWWYYPKFEWPPADWPPSESEIEKIVRDELPDGNWVPMIHYPWYFEDKKRGVLHSLRDRDSRKPPSYKSLNQKSKTELRVILADALQKQMEELLEAEGEDSEVLPDLRRMLHKAKSKVAKQAKLT